MSWTAEQLTAFEIERLEDSWTGYHREIPDSRWGSDEQAEADRRAAKLRAAYDEAGTPASERIAGF